MMALASSKRPSPILRATMTEKPTPSPFISPLMSQIVVVVTPMAAVAPVPMEPTMAVST